MDLTVVEKHFEDVSYHRKPDYMSVDEWQYALRRQFAKKRPFHINNIGDHPVLSDYKVYNPETKNSYKVALRSRDNSMNFCTCNDFKTNMLGTCKHIEAVLHLIRENPDKAKLLDTVDYEPVYTSVFLKYAGDRRVKIRIGSHQKEDFIRLAGKYFDADGRLNESCYHAFESFVVKAAAIDPLFRCYPDAMEFILEKREDQQRHQMVEQKYWSNNNGVFNQLVKVDLFPYQKEGICFAAKAGKCLIADDMGLGKTVQAIATAELLRKEMNIGYVLIICPTSLKYQWKSEIERFTDSHCHVVEGMVTKRMQQYELDVFYKIVSYHTAANDVDIIMATNPDLVILDEAQRIKNYKTRVTQQLKKISSPYKLVLTGTPLENKIEELYSVVQFLDPFRLGPFHRFMSHYRILGDNGKVIGYQNLNSIGDVLSDLMLRRRKKDVLLQLPKRMDKNLLVPMTEEQFRLHDDYKASVSILVHQWKRQGFLKEADRQRLMISLNMMRMACNSTYLIDQETHHDTKIDELMSILDEYFQEDGGKVVIFSQRERMTRLVARELEALRIWFEYLHDGVQSAKREVLFRNFNNEADCKVFLSTDAGGVGLNLQSAALLINLDIPWNPAVLEQRIAHIYRLGQQRNVSIINMVSAHTIEHYMLSVIGFKKSLAEGVLEGG